MPFPRICPISIVVFVATAIAVTRQKRNQSKLDSKKVKNDLLFHIVFVLGAPGVGKGTQCQLLSERLKDPNWVHLSAGDLLRLERQKTNSAIANEINACLSSGRLVSSPITCQLLFNAMQQHHAESSTTHFLIDGFPRSQSNADAWKAVTASAASPATISYVIQFILNYECPEETLIGRLLERGKLTGRSDDNLTTVKARFQTFQAETAPILDYYRKSNNIPVFTIATDKPVETVYEETVQYFRHI